jgi:hypothetical protein
VGGNPRRVRTANNPSDEGSENWEARRMSVRKITGSYRPLKDVHAACGCGWGGEFSTPSHQPRSPSRVWTRDPLWTGGGWGERRYPRGL